MIPKSHEFAIYHICPASAVASVGVPLATFKFLSEALDCLKQEFPHGCIVEAFECRVIYCEAAKIEIEWKND